MMKKPDLRTRLVQRYGKMRLKTSPFIWNLCYKRKKYINDTGAHVKYLRFMGSDMVDALKLMLTMPYKRDILFGLIDASVPVKHASSFFANLKYGRDCDDRARLWSMWGMANGYEAREWIVTSPKKFIRRAHVVTTLSKDDKHYLMDLYTYGYYETVEEALALLDKKYKDKIVVEYMWKDEKGGYHDMGGGN